MKKVQGIEPWTFLFVALSEFQETEGRRRLLKPAENPQASYGHRFFCDRAPLENAVFQRYNRRRTFLLSFAKTSYKSFFGKEKHPAELNLQGVNFYLWIIAESFFMGFFLLCFF
jgi:hypothetical protein